MVHTAIMNATEPDALKKELMTAQEMNFAKYLAGNDKKLRDRAVKKLVKWLAIRSKGKAAFTEENFQRIWSGLFYCMWMSDKFLVQEELSESISKLIHCFHNNSETALLFIKVFIKVMSLEWAGIDHHRIDKFSMLIRRFLRQSLEYCRRKNWNKSIVTSLAQVFTETVINNSAQDGFLFHFIDIFPEELAKVGRGALKAGTVVILLEPFIQLMSRSNDSRTHDTIQNLFHHLERQTDVGIEYEEKLKAWMEQGMPCKNPNELENCLEDCEEDEDAQSEDEIPENAPLDPRAGRVDAVLHPIPVDCNAILTRIRKHMFLPGTTTSGRRSLKMLEGRIVSLKKGKVPETITKPKILLENKKKRRFTEKCVRELMDFTEALDMREDEENELVCSDDDDDDDSSDGCESGSVESLPEERRLKKSKKKTIETNKEAKVKVKHKKEESREGLANGGAKVKKTKKPKTEKETASSVGRRKSLKDSFKVEDISNKPEKCSGTPNKRKALSAWQVHDLKVLSDEYNQIKGPKIIKLETKVFGTPDRGKEPIKETPVKKRVSLTPVFWEKAKEKALKKKSPGNKLLLNPYSTEEESKNSRRISFALDRNQAQGNDEYLEEVRNSPSIPFDGARKPVQSALKSGLSPSPINPFYRLKKFH